MHLSVEDVKRLARLKGRNQILLYLAARTRLQWWATVQELAGIAEVPLRRAELELAALASEGIFERKGDAGRGNLARFRLAGQNDQSDRSTQCVERSLRSFFTRGRARASDPDLSDPGSQDLTRPSVRGVARGTDGRTEELRSAEAEPEAELRNGLVLRLAERWQVSTKVITPGVLRLLKAEPRPAERELLAFLDDAHRGKHRAFDGVGEENQFGRSCTVDRFEIWRASRAKPGPRVAEPREAPRVNGLRDAAAQLEILKQKERRK